MTKLLTIVTLICVVALTAAGVAVLLEARGLLHDASGLLQDTRDDLAARNQQAETLLTAAQQASQKAIEAEGAQIEHFNAEMTEVRKSTNAVKQLVQHTDLRLNGTDNHPELGLLGQFSTVAWNAGVVVQDADTVMRDTGKSIEELQPSLANLARASSAAADAMADPHIRETLAHVDDTSAQTAEAMKQLAGVAANAKTASDLALARLREAMRPQKLVVTVFERLLGLTAEGAQIWYATH
jgi:hypothetical protein